MKTLIETLEIDYEMEDREISIYESDLDPLCLLLNICPIEVRNLLNNETQTVQVYIKDKAIESVNINCYFNDEFEE